MAFGYRPVDRDQMMLLPPDLRDWLPSRHFVWFLLAVLEELDLTGFEADRRLGGVGRRGYDPRMLLGLLIYGYAHGQRSSRRIEELCSTDAAFMVICAQDPPDHTTIARFRQAHDAAIADLFTQVLELAGEAGLGRVGLVAVDGTRIAANASWGRNRRRSWLAEQVDQMMSEADRVDAEEDERFGPDVNGAEVDPEWADPAERQRRIRAELARQQRIRAAAERADEAAAQQAAAQQTRMDWWHDRVAHSSDRLAREHAAAEEKFQRYQQQQTDAQAGSGPHPRGRPAPPPEQAVGVRRAQASLERLQSRAGRAAAHAAQAAQDPVVNLTDPDSGWMPIAKGWIQGYNTQLAVSDDQLVLAVKVTNATVDVGQFEPMMNAALTAAQVLDRGRARANLKPEPVGLLLADAGYLTHHNLKVEGPDRLIATGKRRQIETAARAGHPTSRKSVLIEQMSLRLATPDGLTAYRRRGVTVEPVNGHLKDRHGLRQFARRGQAACQAEAELAAATANLLKIWRRR